MIYKSIAQQLRIYINSDEFQIGDTIPNEKMLADQYHVSRMTLRKAIDLLIEDGLLQRRHGSGTYILSKDVQLDTMSLNSFAEYMQAMGRQGHNEVTEFLIMKAPPAIARQLRIKEGEKIYYIQRVRFVDNNPCELEDSYLPVALFPDLSIHHMEQSKFAYLEQDKQIKILGCYETFTPIAADSKCATLLNVKEGALLLQTTSLAITTDGSYIDFSVMVHNAKNYRISHFMWRGKRPAVDQLLIYPSKIITSN